MIRIGIVDFDSSHSVEFTRILNHARVPEDQWVEGARITAGCVLPSMVLDDSEIRANAESCESMGVELMRAPEDLIGKIDAVMIESDDGRTHLDRARPFLVAGVPTFVDKPLSCSLSEARELVRLAEKHHTPLFSASSLRYAEEVVDAAREETECDPILGALTYSPAVDQTPNPGLVYYGIHAIEMLYALMGPGCVWVSARSDVQAHCIMAGWADGRLAMINGIRGGHRGFGFTAWHANSIRAREVATGRIYHELMRKVITFFETGVAPVSPVESLETIAFALAAVVSAKADGRTQPVSV